MKRLNKHTIQIDPCSATIHVAEEIVHIINKNEELKELIKKDLPSWDKNPATLYNALILFRAYPFVKGMLEKVKNKVIELEQEKLFKLRMNKTVGVNYEK